MLTSDNWSKETIEKELDGLSYKGKVMVALFSAELVAPINNSSQMIEVNKNLASVKKWIEIPSCENQKECMSNVHSWECEMVGLSDTHHNASYKNAVLACMYSCQCAHASHYKMLGRESHLIYGWTEHPLERASSACLSAAASGTDNSIDFSLEFHGLELIKIPLDYSKDIAQKIIDYIEELKNK